MQGREGLRDRSGVGGERDERRQEGSHFPSLIAKNPEDPHKKKTEVLGRVSWPAGGWGSCGYPLGSF